MRRQVVDAAVADGAVRRAMRLLLWQVAPLANVEPEVRRRFPSLAERRNCPAAPLPPPDHAVRVARVQLQAGAVEEESAEGVVVDVVERPVRPRHLRTPAT